MTSDKSVKKVLCAGEALYDFISRDKGYTLGESKLFEKRPGGSPLNIAIALSRLGIDVEFLSVVGSDSFGSALKSYLMSERVDIKNIKSYGKTIIAFASIDPEGKPDFEFYGNQHEKEMFSEEELSSIAKKNFSLFHFGSISLLIDALSTAIERLFTLLKDSATITTLDPNIRPSIVTTPEAYRKKLYRFCEEVDILKLSDEDLYYLTEKQNIEDGLRNLRRKGRGITFVTQGDRGVFVYKDRTLKHVAAFKVDALDTTGCGDAFMAGVISRVYQMNREQLLGIRIDELIEIARFSNAMAAIVATTYGGSTAMPNIEEVRDFLYNRTKEV